MQIKNKKQIRDYKKQLQHQNITMIFLNLQVNNQVNGKCRSRIFSIGSLGINYFICFK
jgi:hypothetical protein